MAVRLSPREFYRALSKRSGFKDEKIQLLWETFGGFVIEELLRYGECYLPYIGNLYLTEEGGKGHLPNQEGGVDKTVIEPYLRCRFRPTEVFKQNLNNGRKPRIELKRERERYRTEMETEKEAKRIEALVRKQEEKLAEARQKRMDRIAKNKALRKMSKKQREEILSKESDDYDEFDYGEVEE